MHFLIMGITIFTSVLSSAASNINEILRIASFFYDQTPPNTLSQAIMDMSNAELCIVEKGAHIPRIEEKDLYREGLRNFLL